VFAAAAIIRPVIWRSFPCTSTLMTSLVRAASFTAQSKKGLYFS
jgi:hypothetical protein